MAEYKDVEPLKKQIADFKRTVNSVKPMNSDYLTGYISALSVVEGAIAEQSTADVVEVVRCKDCIYHYFLDSDYGGYLCEISRLEIHLDDYCCFGERKELDNG